MRERVLLADVFEELRRRSLTLGVDELVAAQRALAAGFGDDRERLIRMCQALWAKSPAELEMVRRVVEQRLPVRIVLPLPPVEKPAKEAPREPARSAGPEAAPAGMDPPTPPVPSPQPPAVPTPAPAAAPRAVPPPAVPRQEPAKKEGPKPKPAGFAEVEALVAKLPNRAETLLVPLAPEESPPPPPQAAPAPRPRSSVLPGAVLPAPSQESLLGFGVGGSSLPLPEGMLPASTSSYFDLVGRLPISRRQMKQAWRGLRRTHRVGISTELSLPGTIDRIHRDGVLEQPVFVPLRQNAARLLLLQDALGSMAPFEKVCQALGETALQADLGRALVIYFHDVPAEPFYTAPGLSRPVDLEPVLSAVAGGSLLIVSDAGAARRRIDEVRVERTARALERLREATSKVCWINPVPDERWEGTSAAAIQRATSVPMVPLTYAGLQAALGVLRGKAIV